MGAHETQFVLSEAEIIESIHIYIRYILNVSNKIVYFPIDSTKALDAQETTVVIFVAAVVRKHTSVF